MKAIVAEIDKKQMIVITDKGDFIKVRRQMSVSIGDEIELKPQKPYLVYRKAASIAACFLVCLFLSTGVYAYYTPYSYVSIDINPSIAMSLNRFERVLSVDALSEDAESIIEDAGGLKNKEIDEALSELLKSASEKGFISKDDENQVMVVVSAKSPEKEEKLAAAVNETAAGELSRISGSYGVTVEKTSVESYKAAVSNKVSPGKEILAGKLKEINPEIKLEEARKMSVKEAVHMLKEGRKALKAAEKDKKDSKNVKPGLEEDETADIRPAEARDDKDRKQAAGTGYKDEDGKKNKGDKREKEDRDKGKEDKKNKDRSEDKKDKEDREKDKGKNKENKEDKEYKGKEKDGKDNKNDREEKAGKEKDKERDSLSKDKNSKESRDRDIKDTKNPGEKREKSDRDPGNRR